MSMLLRRKLPTVILALSMNAREFKAAAGMVRLRIVALRSNMMIHSVL